MYKHSDFPEHLPQLANTIRMLIVELRFVMAKVEAVVEVKLVVVEAAKAKLVVVVVRVEAMALVAEVVELAAKAAAMAGAT